MTGRRFEEGAARRVAPPRCALCEKPTTGRKPFCVDHVLHNPYAASVAAELERRTTEGLAAIRGDWKTVDVTSSRSLEILERVNETAGGTRDSKLIEFAKDIPPEEKREGFALELVHAYGRALDAAGLVVFTECKRRRGTWFYVLKPTARRARRPAIPVRTRAAQRCREQARRRKAESA